MPHIGWPELVVILVVIFTVFGVGKLPQVGSALGKGLKAFRQAKSGLDEDVEETPISQKKANKKVTRNTTKE